MKKLLFATLLLGSQNLLAQFITNNGIEIVNTSTVFTNGDWVNTGGTIRNDGTIITTDSWTNTGTLDAASTGGFVLQYATAKTFTPGGTSFGFLVKEGAGNADISGVFELKDSLAIKGGLITPLTAADVLTINETALVTSEPGSFLQGGNLVRKGTGNLFFPVGRAGTYMPITLVNVAGTNPVITVTLEDAPAGFTAGAGVDALVNFPYVWKVTKGDPTDNAAYVEVEYPATLTPDVTNPIVIRQEAANTYKGMGARFISTLNGVTTVRSYSRGLDGTFSVGRGFPGNLETDKAALLALYNSTEGATAWTTKWNTANDITTWAGVTETGGYITAVNLPGNNLRGPVPAEFADLGGLQSINFANNNLTQLPDLSGINNLASLDASNNRLDFGSILPNLSIPTFNYAGQKELTDPEEKLVAAGTNTSVDIVTGGEGNIYQWKLNGTAIEGATGATYDIAAINRTNMGDYTVEITNPSVPNLVLKSGNKRVLATATISGKIFENATTPVTNGVLTLFKVKTVGAYDRVRENVAINADGTYSLNDVVLDDYVLLAEADAAAYPNDLPTYYNNKLYWEEADQIILNNDVTDLSITMQKKPTEAPKGTGSIAGVFEDTNVQVPGRTEANKRISNAGVSVRRRTNTGRPQAEELILISYLLTNENGEFVFENLEQGEYLINLQFPGVPMDPNSFINISIGPGLARNVEVQALVKDNKITVNKLTITGWDEAEKRFSVYPNPASDALNIQVLDGMSDLSYSITNTTGVQVLNGTLPFQGTKGIAIDELAVGIYFVELKQGETVVRTFRIAINH